MLSRRLPVLSTLFLLLLLVVAVGRGTAGASRRGSRTRPEGRLGARGALDAASRYARSRTELTQHGVRTTERAGRPPGGMDGNTDEQKDIFIKILTGPLYFHPKCRKDFNKLYYSTRDCTIPAYYRRCAILLLRLSNTTRCAEKTKVKDGHVAKTANRRRGTLMSSVH